VAPKEQAALSRRAIVKTIKLDARSTKAGERHNVAAQQEQATLSRRAIESFLNKKKPHPSVSSRGASGAVPPRDSLNSEHKKSPFGDFSQQRGLH